MLLTETRLEGFEQTVGVEMSFELGCYDTFESFGQEWQIGDGTEVCYIVRVKTRFFEDGGDGCQLERLGHRARGE